MDSIVYFEIQAADPKRAIAFYEAVFGWTFFNEGLLPIPYWQIKTPGINGGLLERPVPVPAGPSGTNAYVCSMQVADFEATAKQILANGGIVAMDKFAVPGKCWQGYFQDTEANTFGLFQVDENAA
jgi:predicted enzyme related to lactoylglutathione lyase